MARVDLNRSVVDGNLVFPDVRVIGFARVKDIALQNMQHIFAVWLYELPGLIARDETGPFIELKPHFREVAAQFPKRHQQWITGGATSDYFTTVVRTGGEGMSGISLLLLEKEITYSGENGIRYHPMVVRGITCDA